MNNVIEHNGSREGFLSEYGSLLDDAPRTNDIIEHKIEHKPNVTSSDKENCNLSPIQIAAILSTAFTYGCVMSTLFLLTLPIECQRIESETSAYYSYTVKKAVALGGFAFIAGITQLITPILGLISDNYTPPNEYVYLKYLGKRLPYLILGIFIVSLGVLGQFYSSKPIHRVKIIPDPNDEYLTQTAILGGTWIPYSIFYTFSMIGLNMVYTVMIAFIPDYVPHSQTGLSNGTLALMMVTGSLFGFGSFHLLLEDNVMAMYKLYIIITIVSGLLTSVFVMGRERELHHPSWTIISKKSIFNDTQSILIGMDESVQIHKRFPSLSGLISLLLIEPLQEKTKNDMIAAYWIDISHHRDFFYVTISRFFYYMGISSQTFFLYFIHDEIQHKNIETPKATVALLAIVGQCAGAFTCLPIGIVSDKYFGGQRKIFVYISCMFLAMGNVLLLFCKQLVHMILVCVLLGAANGIYLTMDTSLAVDTLDSDKDEAQDIDSDGPNEGAAQLLGVWGVFGFIGSASGPLIGGLALLFFGRDADATKFYSQRGYEYLFVLSALYFLCSACTLAFVQKKGV